MGWQINEALATVLDDAYREIQHQPEYLLETDGGPVGEKADVYAARLYGLDGELVEQIFLPEVRQHWLKAARMPVSAWSMDADITDPDMWPRTIEFALQSNYATAHIDRHYLPEGAPFNGSTMVAKILCLRYRRRTL